MKKYIGFDTSASNRSHSVLRKPNAVKALFAYWLLIFTLINNTACEEKLGCTDPKADNYDPQATQAGECIYTPQGPLNPSFEIAENTSSFVAQGWHGSYTVSWGNSGTNPVRSTGTDFMPTQGSYYMFMRTNYLLVSQSIFMEDVFFNKVNTLTFDYAVNGTFYVNPNTIKIEILFTSVGTIELWSKSYSGGTVDQKVLTEKITLPPLPNKGRFMVRISSSSNQESLFTFKIDNFKVY